MQNEPKSVAEMNAQCMQLIGKVVENIIPDGAGFSLVIFDFGDTLRDFKYVSNAQREDMIATFRGLLAKWEMEAQRN